MKKQNKTKTSIFTQLGEPIDPIKKGRSKFIQRSKQVLLIALTHTHTYNNSKTSSKTQKKKEQHTIVEQKKWKKESRKMLNKK